MKRLALITATCLVGLLAGRWINARFVGTEHTQPIQQSAPQSDSLLADRQSQIARWETRLAGRSDSQRLLWLAHHGETATSQEMKDLMKLAPEGFDRALVQRWARIDPEMMLDWLQPRFNEAYLTILFDHWMTTDPERAVELVSQDKYNGWKHFLVRSALKFDPELAFKAMHQTGVHNVSSSAPTEAIPAWAAKNPQHAAEIVASPPSSRTAKEAMAQVGAVWAKQDPRAALTFAQSLNPTMSKILTESTMQAWAITDPEAAVTYLNACDDPYTHATLATGLLVGLTDKDPHTALAIAQETLQSQARADAISAILQQVATSDRRFATTLLGGVQPGIPLNTAASSLASSWETKTLQDRDEALAWIDTLVNRDAQQAAITALRWKLQGLGKHGLADFVGGPYGHLSNDELTARAASQKAKQDYDTALAWAKSLPVERRDTAIQAVLKER